MSSLRIHQPQRGEILYQLRVCLFPRRYQRGLTQALHPLWLVQPHGRESLRALRQRFSGYPHGIARAAAKMVSAVWHGTAQTGKSLLAVRLPFQSYTGRAAHRPIHVALRTDPAAYEYNCTNSGIPTIPTNPTIPTEAAEKESWAGR
jgi:hypothetical protein